MDPSNQNNRKESREIAKRTPLDFFNQDSNFLYIFKKTEKLVSALYIISDLFSEEEPLKWKIRESALELMSLTIPLKDKFSDNEKKEFISIFKSEVLEIISFLEVSFYAGLLGETNLSVLKQEFSNLLEVVDTRMDPSRKSPLLFPEDFFSAGHLENVSEDQKQELISKGQFLQETNRNKYKGQENREKSKKKNSQTNSDSKVSDKKSYGPKKKREDLILELIKKKKEVTIKDISNNIKGCSQKTIQRALISLVKKDVLKKEGERRWSKYSLKA